MKNNVEDISCAGIIDSHAHYFDRRFENEYEGGADALLTDVVFPSGIEAVINVGTNPENCICCIEQAKKYDKMYSAVGIHPEDCQHLSGDVHTEVAKIRALLDTEEKRKNNKIVAIGEIGFDYYWQPVDRERQAAFFEAQLELAREFDLPVIIHDREAHGDCFETALKYPEVRGVFHSYSGSAEMARELTKRGWYISFSGVVTFKNARRVREVAAAVDRERVLIETDCPYLSPEPNRGKLNSSANLCYTARALAEAMGLSFEDTVELTRANTKRLFGLK
ncbi:MAG: TatD family hydrolase [Clostridia bacterium]|nr:TatD family hydrolase [Clostridia bacterium]